MSFWNEEEIKVNISSAACMDWWDVSTGLTGAVVGAILKEGSDLTDSIKSLNLNSPFCTFNHLARKNTKTSFLGETIGTDLIKGLSLPFIKQYLSLKGIHYTAVESFGITAFNPLANAYNYMVDHYSFIYEGGSHMKDLGNGNTEIKNYIGTVQYNGNTCYVTSVGFDNSTDKQCYIYAYTVSETTGRRFVQGGSAYYPVEYTTYEFTEVKIPLSVEWTQNQFLYVSYFDNETRRIFHIDITEADEVLKKEYKNKRDIQFPTLVARRDAKRIDIAEKGLFDTTCKATKRLNLDWEDLVAQVNGDLSVIDKPTEEDRNYSENLNDNCKKIYLTLACDIAANSPYVKEYLFRLFKQIYFNNRGFILSPNSTGGEIDYSCQGYHHYIKYGNITYQRKTGKVCKIKHYATKSTKTTRMISQSTGQYSFQRQITDTHLCIYHQVDKDTYYEIIVDNPIHYTDAFNQDKDTHLPEFNNMEDVKLSEIKKIEEERKNQDDDEEDDPLGDPTEFIVPLFPEIVRKMGVLRGGTLVQLSLRFVWETKTKVKKKWWATKWFMVVRIVIYIILIVFQQYDKVAMIELTIEAMLEILLQILIALAIKVAIKLVCKIFKLDAMVEAFINMVADMAMIYCFSGGSQATQLSKMGAAMQVGVASMVVNKQFNLEGIANLLGSVALVSTAGSMADAAKAANLTETAALTATASVCTLQALALNPQFIGALSTKKWDMAIVQGVLAIASSVTLATSAVGTAFKLDSITVSEQLKIGNTDILKLNEDTFMDAIKSISINDVTEALGNGASLKAQRKFNASDNFMSMTNKLVRENRNLKRAESILTAHNNKAVLDMLVYKQLFDTEQETYKLMTFNA